MESKGVRLAEMELIEVKLTEFIEAKLAEVKLIELTDE